MTRVRTAVQTIDWRRLALIGLFVIAAYWLFADAVFAQAAAGASPPAASSGNLKDAAGKCKDFPGLTNKVAACVRLTLVDMSSVFFDGFYKIIKFAITGFVTFAILVYGSMAAMGMMEKPSRDSIVLALKLSMIFYFTVNIDQVYDWQMKMMDAAGAAVISIIPDSGVIDGETDYSQVTCLKKMQDKMDNKPQEGNPVVGPWMAMDCVIDSVIGLKIDDESGAPVGGPGSKKWINENLEGRGMSRGLLAFFFYALQSSTIGMLVAIIGFIFLYSLIFLIIKTLFTYLGGYLASTFLMMLGPLFIPLILFRQTKEYFDKWVKLLISMTLQPIFALLFIAMSVIALDLVMFSGDYSVMYKVAGKASREKPFNLNSYLEEKGVIEVKPKIVAELKAAQSAEPKQDPEAQKKVIGKLFETPPECKKEGAASTNEKCKSYPIRFFLESIDWKKLAEARDPPVQAADGKIEQQMAREVLSAVIFAAIVVFVMNGLLAIVPMMANDILGDFGITPNLFHKMGKLPGQDNLSQAAKELSGKMSEVVSRRL